MATPDSYRSICVKFGVGKATAFRAVRRVTYALHCIAPRFIQWPDEVVAADIRDKFAKISGFPNVTGAIDGTHIKIRAPPTDAASYINRKGFPSINVQVADVLTGSPLLYPVSRSSHNCILDKGPAQDGSSLLLVVSGSSLYIAYQIAAGQRGIIAKEQALQVVSHK
ncbi:putative nuclease HARBI1 [Temnothorax nylanderi]|uniref:putative nuclease HARBI1 n=1 Tax=Temnothorax nylanderi TaxID=102681 RepID=UPI003A83F166